MRTARGLMRPHVVVCLIRALIALKNGLFRAASPRVAARASPAAALRTRAVCDTSCALNLSRRKGVQHQGQQVTERKGRVDSACGRHARQRRWRRGLGCPRQAPCGCIERARTS
jgi:hypothetical protein